MSKVVYGMPIPRAEFDKEEVGRIFGETLAHHLEEFPEAETIWVGLHVQDVMPA